MKTSFSLSDQALDNLETICRTSGVNKTAAVEMALAALAKGLTGDKNMKSKTVYVTAGAKDNPIHGVAQLNGVNDDTILTPALARSAARIAFGHTRGVTASDGKTAYRLTKSGCKKLETEEDIEDILED